MRSVMERAFHTPHQVQPRDPSDGPEFPTSQSAIAPDSASSARQDLRITLPDGISQNSLSSPTPSTILPSDFVSAVSLVGSPPPRSPLPYQRNRSGSRLVAATNSSAYPANFAEDFEPRRFKSTAGQHSYPKDGAGGRPPDSNSVLSHSYKQGLVAYDASSQSSFSDSPCSPRLSIDIQGSSTYSPSTESIMGGTPDSYNSDASTSRPNERAVATPSVFRCRYQNPKGGSAPCRCPLYEASSEENPHPPQGMDALNGPLCVLCEHPRGWHLRPVSISPADLVRHRASGGACFERCKALRKDDGGECPCPLYSAGPKGECSLCGCKQGWHRPTESGTWFEGMASPTHSGTYGRESPALSVAGTFGPPTRSPPPRSGGRFYYAGSPFPHPGPREAIEEQDQLPAGVVSGDVEGWIAGRRGSISTIEDTAVQTPTSGHASYLFSPKPTSSFTSATATISSAPASTNWQGHNNTLSMTANAALVGRRRSPNRISPDLPPLPPIPPEYVKDKEPLYSGPSILAPSFKRTLEWVERRPANFTASGSAPSNSPRSPTSSIAPSQALSGSGNVSTPGAEVFHSAKMRLRASISPQPSAYTFKPGQPISVELELGRRVPLGKYESIAVTLVGEIKGSAGGSVGGGSALEAHPFLTIQRTLYASSSKSDLSRRQWEEELRLPTHCNCHCDRDPPALPSSGTVEGVTTTYSLAITGKRKERLSSNDKICFAITVDAYESRFRDADSAQNSAPSGSEWVNLDQSTASTRIVGMSGASIKSSQLEARVDPRLASTDDAFALRYQATYQFAPGVTPSDRLVFQLAASHGIQLMATGGKQISASGGRGATRMTASVELKFEHRSSGVPAYLVYQAANVAARLEGVIAVSRSDLQTARRAKANLSMVSTLAFDGLSSPIKLSGHIGALLPTCPVHWLPCPAAIPARQLIAGTPAHPVSAQLRLRPSGPDVGTTLPPRPDPRHDDRRGPATTYPGSLGHRPGTDLPALQYRQPQCDEDDEGDEEAGNWQSLLPVTAVPPSDMETASDLDSIIDKQMEHVQTVEALRQAWQHHPPAEGHPR